MGVQQRNIVDNFRLIGVHASAAAYLVALDKTTATEGMCYYDTTLNQLRTHDGSSWSAAGQNGISAGSLTDAFTIGQKITIPSGVTAGIEIEAADTYIGTDGALLLLDNNDTGSDVHGLEVDQASGNSAAAIQITNATTTTKDINGSGDSWYYLGTGFGVAAGFSLGDGANLFFGGTAGTGDVTFDFNDGVAVGTASGGLIVNAVGADECIQFGSGSSYNFDIWFSGNTSTGNMMYWDMDGGINSVGALQLDNADLLVGDNDAIVIGDGYDMIIQSNASDINFTTSTDNTTITLGNGTKDFDVRWYAGTATESVFFDMSGPVVDFDGVDVNFSDSAFIYIGSGDDWKIGGTSALAFLPQTAGDTATWTVGDSAGAKVSDLFWYTTTAGAGLFIDASSDEVFLDLADLRFGDDDYALFGDSAVAGGTTDGTIRWDSSGSTIEVVGNTLFESAVTIDGNLTVSGTLNVTGAWDPDSFALSDDEYITFGTAPDYKILHIASTINVLQFSACAANQIIRFGNGLVNPDIVYFENASTTAANFWLDGSGPEFFVGVNATGLDMTWYSDTSGDYMKWDQNGNTNGQLLFEDSQIIMMDDTKILFGDGTAQAGDWFICSSGTNLLINEVSEAGKAIMFGTSGVGCDVMFYGTTDTYDMTWDQGNDCLFLADNAELCIGAAAGVGAADLAIWSNGTSTSIEIATHLHIATNLGANGKNITFGSSNTNGTDITFVAAASAGHYFKFDAGAETLHFADVDLTFESSASECTYTFGPAGASNMLKLSATDTSVARVQIGTSTATTNGLDVAILNASGESSLVWDAGATTFTIADPTQLIFSGSDVNYTINHQTDAQHLWFAGADNSGANIVLGVSGTNGTNVILQTATASGYNITFDAGAKTFKANSIDLVVASATSSPTYTIGIESGASSALAITASDTAASMLQFGSSTAITAAMGVQFMSGSGVSAIAWDADATTFTVADPTQIVFSASDVSYTINHGTDSDFLMVGATDAAGAKIQFGLSSTNSLDVVFQAATSGIGMTFDAGGKTLTSRDVDIVMIGTASAPTYTMGLESTASSILVVSASDTATSRIAFGSSTASANGMDVVFRDAGGTSNITWNAGATTFTIHTPTQLVFGGSTVSYTMNTYTLSDPLVVAGTDAAGAKVTFGASGVNTTNGVDVTFFTNSGEQGIVWDSADGSLTMSTTGVGVICGATSGVWEHGLQIPTTDSAPTTSTATGSGAIIYSHDASALYIFTGSSWIHTAAGALVS